MNAFYKFNHCVGLKPIPWFWRLALFAMLVIQTLQVQAQNEAAGRVMFVVGKATKQNAQGQDQAVIKDMDVRQGDRLITGPDAYLYTRMSDGALLVLRPGSTLSVDVWRYDAQKPEQSQIKYTLHNGLSRYVSGRGSQAAKDQFRFNTPLAAIGVRGTDFTVWSQPEITEVSVRSGGVVVSGFDANCKANALGPCEGRTAAELFAKPSAGYLQIKAGEKRPQLIHNNDKLGPEQNIAPLANEPIAKEDKSTNGATGVVAIKGDMRSGQDVTKLIGPAVEVPPPPPPLAVWGRWGDVASATDRDRIVANLLTGRELLAINSYYILARAPAAISALPETGTGSFKLVEHEGIVIHPITGKSENTKATDGSLRIDFAKKSFQTDLKLEALGQTVQIGAVGKVEEGGVLRSNSFTSTSAIQGLVGGNGGKEAVYIYRQPGTVGLELSGAAVWNR
jgi:hypothetical protein